MSDLVSYSLETRSRFVARLASLATETVDGLRACLTTEACRNVIALDRALDASRGAISDDLFAAIGACTDHARRSVLIDARRRLFNGKPIGPRAVAAVSSAGDALARALSEHLQLIVERNAALNAVRAHYDSELCETRRRAQSAVKDPLFIQGLASSSVTLLDNVRRYAGVSGTRFGARDAQIERGLLRYLSRAGRKATPFSTFCTVIPGRFIAGDGTAGLDLRLTGAIDERFRRVRLNKQLSMWVWDAMKSSPGIRTQLRVGLNRTLEESANELAYLTFSAGVEAFHRLPANDVVRRIRDYLRDGDTTIGDVVRHLASGTPDAAPESITAFVERLIEIGVLAFRRPDSDQDPDWDLVLEPVLASIDDPQARAMARMLRDLRALLTSVECASADEFIALVAAGRRAVECGLVAIESANKSQIVEQPFFIDLSAAATLEVPRTNGVAEALSRFGELIDLLQQLAEERIDKASMRHFFESEFGSACRGVPLLRFYETYYRKYMKEHRAAAANGKMPKDNPFGLDLVRRIRLAQENIVQTIRARWQESPNAEEISISRCDLERAMEGLPRNRSLVSAGAFCQLVGSQGDDASVRVLLKDASFHAGFGRFPARFLYLFPDDFRAGEVADNRSLSSDWLAEISDDGASNPNLHPILADRSLAYPTTEYATDGGGLSALDLDVVPDPSDPAALALRHRSSGSGVIPLGLGLINPRVRPELFQLLYRLSPFRDSPLQRGAPAGRSLHRLSNPGGEPSTTASEIAYRPRCVYEGRVILSRRHWYVPAAAVPRRRPDERPADFFLRVQQWREANSIPERVFVTISQAAAASSAEPPPDSADDSGDDGSPAADESESGREQPAPRKRHRTSWKPQFIDFSSPLLLELFDRMPKDHTNYVLKLYECLPDTPELPADAGRQFAFELILQADRPQGMA